MLIYHIVLPEVWASLNEAEDYAAESLSTEGFIHCSYADQLDVVLTRYYANTEKVLILTIDPDKLSSRIVAEPSTNNEIYPHIYGRINRDAIIGVEEKQLSI